MTNTKSFFKRILAILLSIVFAISSFAVTGFSTVTALADDGEYFIMAYFTGNGDAEASTKENQAIRFAVSSDGERFSALNNNDPIIKQVGGTRNVRDPYIFKGQDNYYYLIGTDLDVTDTAFWGNQPQMVIWRSSDLITWDHETYINAAQICGLNDDQVQRTWAPQVIWDTSTNKYMVYFAFAADGYQSTTMYYMLTDNLLDQSHYSTPVSLYNPGADDIDADITYQNGVYYMFYKDETTGRKTICLATADNCKGPYTYVGQLEQKSETGALEGCEVYTVGNNYYLMADRYGDNGNFAIYNLGTDLSAISADGSGVIPVTGGNPVSTINATSGFSNLTVRHGSVMHISKAQYDALIATYGGSTPEDITFCFDKSYSHENAWGYDNIKDASGYSFDIMTNTGKYSYVNSQGRFLSLNGGNIFVNEGTIKDMFKSGNSWTLSFNANVVTKRGAPLFALTSGPSPSGSTDWIRFLDNGDFYINNGSYTKIGSTDITTTTDYMFTITYNGSYITLYKDGEKAFTSNVGTIDYDRYASTSYVAFGWTDTIGTNGVNAAYTNVRFRNRAITAGEVASEYTDNMIYQYNEGTHEAIDGRANVTYNSPKTTTTYVGKKGTSFAISGWVNIGAYKHDNSVLFEFGEGGTGNGKNYLSLLEDGTIKWCWSEGSTPRYVDIASIYDFAVSTYYYVQINIIPDGNQYHFQAFVNGESARDVTSGYNSMQTYNYGPINYFGSNRALSFGQGNAYWTTAGYNIIDDIRVYNRAVDAAANYEKVCIEDAAADARTYVLANLESYDVEAETNALNTGVTERKAYHYESECPGGYSNVLAQTAPNGNDHVSTEFAGNTSVGSNKYNLFWPAEIALLYDGEHTTAMPVVAEISGSASMTTLVVNQDSGKSPDWEFAHYWTGSADTPWHDNIWKEWPGSTYTYPYDDYPSESNGGKALVTDGNSHLGYKWGSDYDWEFTASNTRFLWNRTDYIGSGNTSTYFDHYETINTRAWQSGEKTVPNCTHHTYVVNYKPVYDMLKASSPTEVPNAGGPGLKAVYENLVKDHESDWTTDSLNQFYVAAYKVLTCNPVDYSEATYRANFSGTVNKAAANIKSAVSEFNKINLKSRASFGDLESAVEDAQDILDNSADNYTAASIAALEAAVDGVTFLDYSAEERANMAADIYQDDIDEETTAVSTAYAALIGKIAITYDPLSGNDVVVLFEPGATAADVEAAAPALPANNYDSVANKHYTYSWDKDFTAVTAAVTYTQERSEVAHDYTSYTHVASSNPSQHTATCAVNAQNHTDTLNCVFESEHFEASGNTNSYTRYTCKDCGYYYDADFGAQDWDAYDTAVAAYDAKAAEEDFESNYTEDSRTAFAEAASSKLTKADTVSQSAIDTAAAALEAAVNGLVVITPDNGYNLTLEDTVDVNFYIDTEFYDAEGGHIEYTFLANPNDKSAERTTYTVQDGDLVEMPDGRRKLAIDVAPAQLAEKFSIDVFDENGVQKNNESIEASIADYCQAALAIEEYAEYHAVLQSLLDYGALADEYFGYAAISKEVTGEDYAVPHSENYKAPVDAESFKSKAHAKFTSGADASGNPVQITGITYVALVDPEFRFYVSQENEVWAAMTEVSVLEGEGLDAEMVKTDLGHCVRVTGLKSSDFGKTFKIQIGEAVLEYNGYAYLYTTLREQSTVSNSLKNLTKGVYRYAAACDDYFNNKD